MTRRNGMQVRAHCRHRGAHGKRCDQRIPEHAKYCRYHRGQGSPEKRKRELRAKQKAERAHRKRERAIAAYRRRLDPGPLPLE